MLADANAAMRPSEIAQPGRTLLIPIPAGVPARMPSELTLSLAIGALRCSPHPAR